MKQFALCQIFFTFQLLKKTIEIVQHTSPDCEQLWPPVRPRPVAKVRLHGPDEGPVGGTAVGPELHPGQKGVVGARLQSLVAAHQQTGAACKEEGGEILLQKTCIFFAVFQHLFFFLNY